MSALTRPPVLLIATLVGSLLALTAGCGGDDDAARQDRTAHKKAGVEASGIIAFRRYTDSAETHGEIFTIRPDGTHEQRVSRPPAGSTDEFPRVSPDGRRLAWTRCPEGGSCAVYTAAIDGSGLKRLEVTCRLKPICDASGVAWHPDGERVVVNVSSGRARQVGEGDQIQRSELVEVNLANGRQRVIAGLDNWQGDLTDASWSPDGNRLAADHLFSPFSNRSGERVEIVSAKGGTPRAVTPLGADAGDGPEWSPDGHTLLFRTNAESDDGIGSQLATVPADGGRLRRLDPFGDKRPVRSSDWSPDGRWIVFAAQGKANAFDLFVMKADGSHPRPLVRTPVTDSAPDWGGS